MPDGKTRATYSPNWHGTMPKCPKNVEVLLYNDKEGYGIAWTEDNYAPPEVRMLSEAEAKGILALASDEDGVYFGQKLKDRWLPEALEEYELGETAPNQPDTTGAVLGEVGIVIDSFLKFCPSCHQIVARIVKFENGSLEVWQGGRKIISGLKTANLILTCSSGHKVRMVL